jgi:DNA-binding winged helix-turn-helix (wHTH) protein/tetratricopeptide (TPR) repeat protein
VLQREYERLDLAHAEPFPLGSLVVEPSIRLVRNGDRRQIIEPRVMQLLVALHSARGEVLSRDDLMRLCWGGVIVGENALQRTVSRARSIAARIADSSFDIETIRGVGYRLVKTAGDNEHKIPTGFPPRRPLSRRSALALGAGAVVAAVPLLSLLPRSSAQPVSAAARAACSRGETALRDENGESCKLAVALLEEAVRDSPRFAAAWASLSIGYWQNLIGVEGVQADHYAALGRSAARKALAIDADTVEARGTLAMLESDFRRWRDAAISLQAVPGGNRNWAVLRWLGWVASDAGQWNSAIEHFRKALAVESLLPHVRRDLAVAYWGAGSPIETERTLAEATRLWPADYGLWEFQFRYHALTGNAGRAAELVTNESTQPLGLGPAAITKRLRLLDALDGKGHRDFVIRTYLEEVRQQPLNTVRAAQVLAALDAVDEVYALLDGYFLERGPFGVPISRHALRPTYFLFLPPLLKFHSEPRFIAIMKEIGLKAVS